MAKLKLSEVLVLTTEIKNLFSEESISFGVKYDLRKLNSLTSEIVSNFENTKLEIFKKYGKPQDGGYTLEGSEHLDTAVKELNDLLEKEENVDFKLKLEDFSDLKSSKSYVVIMELIE